MKTLGGILLVLALVSGCSAGAGGSTSDTPPAAEESPAKIRTLAEVASAACGGKRVVREKPDELDMFTSAGATCGNVEVHLFDGPGARGDWVDFADQSVLVGGNWVVWIDTFDNAKRYARIQDAIGGKVEGPS